MQTNKHKPHNQVRYLNSHKSISFLAYFSISCIFYGGLFAQGELTFDPNPAFTNYQLNGTEISFNVRVLNTGVVNSPVLPMGYYAWTNPLDNNTRVSLGNSSILYMDAGDHWDESHTYEAFGKGIPPGEYVVGFKVDRDDNFWEFDESNNDKIWYTGDKLIIPDSPNITAGSGNKLSRLAGGLFKFTAKIKNNGTWVAGGSKIRYYISENQTLTAMDHYLGQDIVGLLFAGQTKSEDITFDPQSLGLAPGHYYIGFFMDVDDQVNEWDEWPVDNLYLHADAQFEVKAEIGGFKNRVSGSKAGLLDQGSLTEFSLYPNPASEHISITFKLGTSSNLSLNIMDLSGRKMYTKALLAQAGLNEIQLPTGELAKGMYILQLQQGKTLMESKKFMVSH